MQTLPSRPRTRNVWRKIRTVLCSDGREARRSSFNSPDSTEGKRRVPQDHLAFIDKPVDPVCPAVHAKTARRATVPEEAPLIVQPPSTPSHGSSTPRTSLTRHLSDRGRSHPSRTVYPPQPRVSATQQRAAQSRSPRVPRSVLVREIPAVNKFLTSTREAAGKAAALASSLSGEELCIRAPSGAASLRATTSEETPEYSGVTYGPSEDRVSSSDAQTPSATSMGLCEEGAASILYAAPLSDRPCCTPSQADRNYSSAPIGSSARSLTVLVEVFEAADALYGSAVVEVPDVTDATKVSVILSRVRGRLGVVSDTAPSAIQCLHLHSMDLASDLLPLLQPHLPLQLRLHPGGCLGDLFLRDGPDATTRISEEQNRMHCGLKSSMIFRLRGYPRNLLSPIPATPTEVHSIQDTPAPSLRMEVAEGIRGAANVQVGKDSRWNRQCPSHAEGTTCTAVHNGARPLPCILSDGQALLPRHASLLETALSTNCAQDDAQTASLNQPTQVGTGTKGDQSPCLQLHCNTIKLAAQKFPRDVETLPCGECECIIMIDSDSSEDVVITRQPVTPPSALWKRHSWNDSQ